MGEEEEGGHNGVCKQTKKKSWELNGVCCEASEWGRGCFGGRLWGDVIEGGEPQARE